MAQASPIESPFGTQEGYVATGILAKHLAWCQQLPHFGRPHQEAQNFYWVPPLFVDHDNIAHDLFALDASALDVLLTDAWTQHVASQVRAALRDLQGIDRRLTLVRDEQLTPLQLAQISSLREGSFVSPWQPSKFDLTKSPLCDSCGVPDKQLHWLECPKFAESLGQT